MDRDLQTILLRDNAWLNDIHQLQAWLDGHLPDPYLKRSALSACADLWQIKNRAHLVVGPRQAGKTTLVWAHLAKLGERVLYVDCEQGLVREWCKSAPLFLDELDSMLDEPVPLFFDEIQHLSEAGLFLKGLVDRKVGVPIIASGSSAFHLNSRTRESLAGRATRTVLLPFSLFEVCDDLSQRPPIAVNREKEDRTQQHLVYGGYPEIWIGNNPELLLTELVDAIVMLDASDLHRIARPDAFRKLLRLAARQVGSLVNVSEWASLSGVSRDTAASYLEILESAHIVRLVPPFAGGRRSELTGRPKVFFVDNGVRNHLVGDFNRMEERGDTGPLLENWVFTELAKSIPRDASLFFWRSTSGAEVDFVVQIADRIIAFEVKAGSMVRPKLSRAARSFIEAYAPAAFVVVNGGLRHGMEVKNTPVLFRRPFELPEVLAGLYGSDLT